MLEPDEGKLSSPLLSGLAPSNGGWLLGGDESGGDPRRHLGFHIGTGQRCSIGGQATNQNTHLYNDFRLLR